MRRLNRLRNAALAAGFLPDFLSFHMHLSDASRIQTRKLFAYLEKNRDTVFGKQHGFERLRSLEAFQEEIPVRSYEDFRPYIERIADGEAGVLTREKVLLLEPTGGTVDGSKWIPYTRSLKREFQVAVHTWILDLYRNVPGLSSTRSYWSISPVSREKQVTKAGIPIGFENDADYLGVFSGLLQSVFPVPPQVKEISNLENFQHVTSFFLLAARDLGLISVWNPTFLILLLEYMERHPHRLARDLHDGSLRCPAGPEEAFRQGRTHPMPDRAREIEAAFGRGGHTEFTHLWKMLKIVSCWTDGISGIHASRLAGMLPGVVLQPKGLLATEGVISFPLARAEGAVPAYSSHFMEFLPEGGGSARLLHELDQGGVYTVLITTAGGLYRYNLGDKIRVSGRYRGLPVIRFHGRDQVSDLVGEKLHERHVQSVIEKVLEEHGIPHRFLLFAPETDPCGGHYRLYLETGATLSDEETEAVAGAVDQALMTNFHYKYARDLGQLLRPEVFPVGQDVGQKVFLKRCTESGQRLGDIKQRVLDPRTGWSDFFSDAQADEHPLR